MSITTVITGIPGQDKGWRSKLFFRSSRPTVSVAHISTSPQTAVSSPQIATPLSAPTLVSTQARPQHTSGLWLLPGIPACHPCSDSDLTRRIGERLKSELDANVTRSVGSRTILFMLAGKQVDRLYPSLVITYDDNREKREACRFIVGLEWLRDDRNEHKFNFHVLLAEPKAKAKKTMGAVWDKRGVYMKASILIPLDVSTLCGATVLVRNDKGGSHKRCIFGGLVNIDGALYGLLARHPFDESDDGSPTHWASQDSKRSSSMSSEDERPYTLSFEGSEEAEKAFPQPSIYITGSGDKSTEFDEKDNSLDVFTNHLSLSIRIYVPNRADSGMPSKYTRETDTDWALADMSEVPLDLLSRVLMMNKIGDCMIEKLECGGVAAEGPMTVAGMGPSSIYGFLHPVPVCLRFQTSCHDVRLLVLERPLSPGNSGAWVASGDTLYGFVIAAQGALPWCYMVPIHLVISDIKQTLQVAHLALPRHDELMDIAKHQSLALVTPKASTTFVKGSSLASFGLRLGGLRPLWRRNSSNSLSRVSSRDFRAGATPLMQSNLHVDTVAKTQTDPILDQGITAGSERQTGSATISADAPQIPLHSITTPGNAPSIILPSTTLNSLTQSSELHTSSIVEADRLTPTPPDRMIFPQETECVLHVTCGPEFNSFQRRLTIKWPSTEAYRQLDTEATSLLREYFTNPKETLYRKAGNCRIVRKRDLAEVSCGVLERENQWSEVVLPMVVRIAAQNLHEQFHFEIYWDYFNILLEPKPGQSFSDTVRAVIYKNMKRNWQGKRFIPRKELAAIMSSETVFRLCAEDESLKKIVDFNCDNFATDVYHMAERLLAVCVFQDLPLSILFHLRKRNFADYKLPLLFSDGPPEVDRRQFDFLVDGQGAFFPHTFVGDAGQARHVTLSNQTVLPVIFDEKTDLIGEGSFGRVFKVKIDPSHHSFSPSTSKLFALKSFNDVGSRTTGDFDNESKNLVILSQIPHPNIVTHLASWTQDRRFYILFPLADRDLSSFMKMPSPVLTKSFVLNILSQMKGLADGISVIHSLGPSRLDSGDFASGRAGFHHDLKPQNILVFSDPSIRGKEDESAFQFKISDFGTAKIQNFMSGSLQRSNSHQTTSLRVGDVVYGAPDFVQEGTTSRPYDMWSLGCIFLEIMVWIMGSPHGNLDDFELARFDAPEPRVIQNAAFWHISENNLVCLKPAVREELEYLRDFCEGLHAFRDLVWCIGRLLTINPRQRLNSVDLCNNLSVILQQAKIELEDPYFFLNSTKPGTSMATSSIAEPFTPIRPQSVDDRAILGRPTTPHPLLTARARTLNLELGVPELEQHARYDSEITIVDLGEDNIQPRDADGVVSPQDGTIESIAGAVNPDSAYKSQVDYGNSGVVSHPALLIHRAIYRSNTSKKRASSIEARAFNTSLLRPIKWSFNGQERTFESGA